MMAAAPCSQSVTPDPPHGMYLMRHCARTLNHLITAAIPVSVYAGVAYCCHNSNVSHMCQLSGVCCLDKPNQLFHAAT